MTLNSSRPAPPTFPATTVPEVEADADAKVVELVFHGISHRQRCGERLIGVIFLPPGSAEDGQ
jgi:hypothetical protein